MKFIRFLSTFTRHNSCKNNPASSMCWINHLHKNSVCIKHTDRRCVSARLMLLCRNFSCSRTSSSNTNTVFSLSSGHGKCGVAVIRISGPQSKEVLKQIGKFKDVPSPKRAVLRRLVNPSTGEAIDKGIVLFFSKPESFTGEDCVELHVHGGPAVVSALLAALNQVQGCRQAEPGEFTKRAFLNGKLDLTEVEGLGDLIHAETEAQRKQALRQMDGELGNLYRRWTQILTKCLADVEAFIDFSEDQDIEETVVNQVNERISQLLMEISTHLDDDRRGERLRQGVQVAIMGAPNVGKSSLLNVLCQRSAAIVTPIAGTTRDVIETAINIGGFPVVLSDTAGIRHSEDMVENEGIRRALERCHKADLKILMLDSSSVEESLITEHGLKNCISNSLESLTLSINTEIIRNQITGKCKQSNCCNNSETRQTKFCKHKELDMASDEEERGSSLPRSKDSADINEFNIENTIVVLNKIDILKERDLKDFRLSVMKVRDQKLRVCLLSCLTKDGFAEFVTVLKEKVEKLCGDPLIGHPSLTQDRHRDHLQKCVQSLHRYSEMIEDNDIVLGAQCLRRGLRRLGSITGRVTSEDILDVIFKDFCIGK